MTRMAPPGAADWAWSVTTLEWRRSVHADGGTARQARDHRTHAVRERAVHQARPQRGTRVRVQHGCGEVRELRDELGLGERVAGTPVRGINRAAERPVIGRKR